MHPFEAQLTVQDDDIDLEVRYQSEIEWLRFLLNPRCLRGSDFLMRWSQGVWSEQRIAQAVNNTHSFWAIPYGPSGTAPDNDVRAFELYFERLEAAGLGTLKRPDLLVFRKDEQAALESLVASVGGLAELPFIPESDSAIAQLLSKAIVAVECENSLWKAEAMPDYGATLKPQRRLEGKVGLKKSAVLPTVILKDEDREPLIRWQTHSGVPIHIWHMFYDKSFGIALDEVQRLINEGYIQATEQIFQAPGGATTRKALYKIYYHYAYALGDAIEEPLLSAKSIIDKNGHILPYVHFDGGLMSLTDDAVDVLRSLSHEER